MARSHKQVEATRDWTRALLEETARERTQALLGEVPVRTSFRVEESSGAFSIEEEKLMVRCTRQGTQSQESEKEKRWWERWRDEEKKKEGQWRKGRRPLGHLTMVCGCSDGNWQQLSHVTQAQHDQ